MSDPGPNKSRIPVEAVDGNGNKVYGEVLEPGYTHKRPVKDVTAPETDFYVTPDGTAFRLDDIKNNINPFNLKMTQTVRTHATDIASKGKYKGEYNRPYIDSDGTGLLIQEIIDSSIPMKD